MADKSIASFLAALNQAVSIMRSPKTTAIWTYRDFFLINRYLFLILSRKFESIISR